MRSHLIAQALVCAPIDLNRLSQRIAAGLLSAIWLIQYVCLVYAMLGCIALAAGVVNAELINQFLLSLLT